MIEIDRLDPQSWAKLSENAHLISFGTHKPADWDRIDFALLSKKGGQLLGYITCQEHNSHTVYWQFGGTFPGAIETSLSWQAYHAAVEWTRKRYKRIWTLIENDNTVMLKMAMKVGFRVMGVRTHVTKEKTTILLEHVLEFENGN